VLLARCSLAQVTGAEEMRVDVHARLRRPGVLGLDRMAEEHSTLFSSDFLCTMHSLRSLSKDRGDLAVELSSSKSETEGSTLAWSKL